MAMKVTLQRMGGMAALLQDAGDGRSAEQVVEESTAFFTRVVNYAGLDMAARATTIGLTLEEWSQVKEDYENGVKW